MSVFFPRTHVNHGTALPLLLHTYSFFVSAGFLCLPEATERITLSSHSLIKVVKKSCQSLMHFKEKFLWKVDVGSARNLVGKGDTTCNNIWYLYILFNDWSRKNVTWNDGKIYFKKLPHLCVYWEKKSQNNVMMVIEEIRFILLLRKTVSLFPSLIQRLMMLSL